jgi:hypothetical protein
MVGQPGAWDAYTQYGRNIRQGFPKFESSREISYRRHGHARRKAFLAAPPLLGSVPALSSLPIASPDLDANVPNRCYVPDI